MLELKNISKWYNVGGGKTYILRDVNLIIREGEFISIMGPSVQENRPCLTIRYAG
jgi:ABC-type lipoprotein export system ATPase subunit